MLTCQPMALAACSVASTGIDELIDDWPAEMMTIFLPLTAGREADDGGCSVPLYRALSAADSWLLTPEATGACWPAGAELEPPEPDGAALLPELLHAATRASVSAERAVAGSARRPARRVMEVLLGGDRPIGSSPFRPAGCGGTTALARTSRPIRAAGVPLLTCRGAAGRSAGRACIRRGTNAHGRSSALLRHLLWGLHGDVSTGCARSEEGRRRDFAFIVRSVPQ